jgi:transposase
MRRFELSDEQYQRILPLLPGQESHTGFTAFDNKLFLDAVLWIARTGAPWRDLPERFGRWNSVYQRFRRWCEKGTWKKIYDSLQDPDLEWLLIDSTVVRSHQHAAGAAKSTAKDEQIGRSSGGHSTKIHIAVDGLGNVVRIILSPGNESDIRHASTLVAGLAADAVVADKGYDSDEFAAELREQGIEVVIPPRSNRIHPRDYDRHIYKVRQEVERVINKMKQLRRVATRYEKTACSFLGILHLAGTMLLLM